MITVNALLDAGYREYPAAPEAHIRLFQKTIRDEQGKKAYFINFKYFQIPELSDRWDTDVRFYAYTAITGPEAFQDHHDISLELIAPKGSVSDVERFYADAYRRLGCVPDIHNND